MIFTDWIYFVFFGLVFALHWGMRGREARLSVLLVASTIFYGWWDWRFLLLIGFVITVSWIAALYAGDRARSMGQRKLALWLGVGTALAMLGVFKYFGFFVSSGLAALNALGLEAAEPTLSIILPVGISFYVFQAISYIVDVWRGDLAADSRIRRVALYIGFFPQLVAGPIVRAASFFPQMERDHRLSRALVWSGARAFLLGFVYKAGLADNIAPVVDPVFADVSQWSNAALLAATMAFSAQIYFDFAGYSLMAIGVARLLGYYIPDNFNTPYASTSITEFWRRWHISLSGWLRDYLYIPLGGNRGGKLATYRNLMATMLFGGLWHGAAWTFVVWGALHGAALAAHKWLMERLPRLPCVAMAQSVGAWVIGLVLTQVFVLFTWVPFRATSFTDTFTVWSAMIGIRDGAGLDLPLSVWLIPLAVILDAVLTKTRFRRRLQAVMARPVVYWGGMGVLAGLVLALYPINPAPFVYFQF
jgi:D-alanyl-lipoteichoic acid acyltransferase DltB (MBOAT superfamily)